MKQLFLFGLAFLMMSSCCCQTSDQGEAKSTEDVVIENILNRRSIRAYKSEQIKESELDKLITSAINAPSARNLQPWEVRVIQNPEILAAINSGFGTRSESESARSTFHNSPALIIVAHDTNNSYGAFDCGLLTQNILLAAEAMNIGTCVVGHVIPTLNLPEAKDLIEQLNFSEGYKPIVGISLGYKDQAPEAKPRDAAKVQVIK